MSEQCHKHEQVPSSKWFKVATVGSAILGVTEVAAAYFTGSTALVADAVHNSGDTAGYALQHNAAEHQRNNDKRKMRSSLKIAGWLICAGSFFVGAKATQELMSGEHDKPDLLAVPAAVAAGGVNIALAKKFHADAHEHGGAHYRGYLHSVSDVISSFITVGAVSMSQIDGFSSADAYGAIATSAITIFMNIPIGDDLNHHD